MNLPDLLDARRQVLGGLYQILVRRRNRYWEYTEMKIQSKIRLKELERDVHDIELEFFDAQRILDPERPEGEIE